MESKLPVNANYGASLKQGKGSAVTLSDLKFIIAQNFDLYHPPVIEEHRRLLSNIILKSERAEKELWSKLDDTNSYGLFIEIYGKLYSEDSVEPLGYYQNIATLPDFGVEGVRASVEDSIKNFKPLKHNDYIGHHEDDEVLFITKVIVMPYTFN